MQGDAILQVALALENAPTPLEAERLFGLVFAYPEPTERGDGVAAVGDGFFVRAEIGMDLWSRAGLLILRARTSPPVRRVDLGLERYGTATVRRGPNGVTAHRFHVRSLVLTFELDAVTEHLRNVFLEWPALRGAFPFRSDDHF